MIVFCKKRMPYILKVSCDSDWNCNTDLHIEESFNTLRIIMREAEYQFIFLWVLNENLPPFSSILKIVSNLILLHNDLKLSIDFNILYCTNEDTIKLVEKILCIYQPSRPIKIARNNEDVLKFVNQ